MSGRTPALMALLLLATTLTGCSASQSSATPSPSSAALATLNVVPVTRLTLSALRPAPLPHDQVTDIAQAIVNQPVPTSVHPILIDAAQLRAGAQVTVVAGKLGSGRHDALFILQSSTSRAVRLVHVSNGVAAGVITLPDSMPSGRWEIAAEDMSGLRTAADQHPDGTVLLDLGIFTVP